MSIPESVHHIIHSLEHRIQQDEGHRGISDLIAPNELMGSSLALINCKKIAIITGFPCLITHTPPTETDGPMGAIAIAKTLLKLGKDVVIVTDECNEDPLLACAAAAPLYGPHLSLESYPPRTVFDEKDMKRLLQLYSSIDCVIAIERAGPASDGVCRTMKGLDMNHLVAPLELLLLPPSHDSGGTEPFSKITSIGIGDGGNEVGMGKIFDKVCNSRIPNAQSIACLVPSDHIIVASVSNWGGYALAAAVAVLHHAQNLSDAASDPSVLRVALEDSLPSEEEQRAACQGLVNAGARDGITKEQALYVDGMPLEASLEVLRDIRRIALGVLDLK